MIVEVFVKGSNFNEFVTVHHNIQAIDNKFNTDKFILVILEGRNITIDASTFELRVSA